MGRAEMSKRCPVRELRHLFGRLWKTKSFLTDYLTILFNFFFQFLTTSLVCLPNLDVLNTILKFNC